MLHSRQLSDCVTDLSDPKETWHRGVSLLNKNDSDLLNENCFIIWLYAETKDFCNEFRTLSRIGVIRQAFCELYGFVPLCSVGALVTLHHVSTVTM